MAAEFFKNSIRILVRKTNGSSHWVLSISFISYDMFIGRFIAQNCQSSFHYFSFTLKDKNFKTYLQLISNIVSKYNFFHRIVFMTMQYTVVHTYICIVWPVYDVKCLCSTGFKMPTFRGLQFHFIKWLKTGIPTLKSWHFEATEDIMTKFKSQCLHIS